MPIRYWIFKQADITYARWSGLIDAAEMRRNFLAYLNDPDYRPGRPELIDLRTAMSGEIDLGNLTMLLNKANSQNFGAGSGTLTSVLAPEDMAFGLSRQYQGLASSRGGIRVSVNRHEAGALAVLGIDKLTIDEFLAEQPEFTG